MKVIHLADLHLGKCVLEQSMIEDQKYILNEIVGLVEEKNIDLVLIAGDVYDKGIPSVEAVLLFNDFLTRLYRMKVKVFIISGNHDSKDRLSFGNELFVDNGIYIEGVFQGNLRKVTLEDQYGKIHIYMLPFVKPADVRGYYPDEMIDSYHKAIEVIMNHTKVNNCERNILMIHQFVTANGVDLERSDSETISLGGIDQVDVHLFDNFDYVAMGHVHGAQKLLRDTVRYAGSPLKYSFSEVYQKKSVPIIEFGSKGEIDLELIDLKPIRDMRVIQGKLEQLLKPEIYVLGNVNDYINVILTDEDYIMDAIGKLRKVYKNVLKLEYKNKRSEGIFISSNIVSKKCQEKSELELFMEFYKNQNNIDLDRERKKIVQDIIQSFNDK